VKLRNGPATVIGNPSSKRQRSHCPSYGGKAPEGDYPSVRRPAAQILPLRGSSGYYMMW